MAPDPNLANEACVNPTALHTTRAGLWLSVVALAALSCSSSVEPVTTDDAGGGGANSLGPCDPPLTVAPLSAAVNPFDLITLVPSGGNGQYRFALTNGTAGGVLNDLTGVYLAPDLGEGDLELSDTVVITDLGCEGEARVDIRVVPHMRVRPSSVLLPLGLGFVFEVVGGSGAFTFDIADNGARGSVTATGTYSPGAVGTDVVRVTDDATGERADTTITVSADAALTPQPDFVALPVGSTFELDVRGGSGFLSATVLGEAATIDNLTITGLQAGQVSVSLTDDFTNQTATVTVDVVAPLGASFSRAGDSLGLGDFGRARGLMGERLPLDIDRNGYHDVIYASPEADIDHFNSGAVYIYSGSAAGLGAEPVRVISGHSREERFGSRVVAGYFNDDPLIDLAVSASLADIGASNTGAVYLFRGVKGGFFSDEPVRIFSGDHADDRIGEGLAACDFNGDGRMDLAMSGTLDEDRTQTQIATNQGGVWVFLGYPDGLLAAPDSVVYGMRPDADGEWQHARGLQIGHSLDAGDFDGDGLCDLAVGSLRHNSTYLASPPNRLRNNDGAVFIYAGRAPGALSQGGVTDEPRMAIAGSQPNDGGGQLGREVGMGDVNGDGRADLVVAQPDSDAGGATANAGAVHVFFGRPLPSTAPTGFESPASADFAAAGDSAYDYLGWDIDVADTNGDEVADLLLGAFADEPTGAPTDAGSVKIYRGVRSSVPAAAPSAVLAGSSAGDRLGQAVVFAGDVDRDGFGDVVALAGRGDLAPDAGIDVGLPWVIPGNASVEPYVVEVPGRSAGDRQGWAVGFAGDFDGNGQLDLAVSAPFADVLLPTTIPTAVNTGLVRVYSGAAAGVSPTASWELQAFRGHGAGDVFGYDVSGGDFDGDRVDDLIVLARNDSRPGAFGAGYDNSAGCPAGGGYNRSAVYVFRGEQDVGLRAQPAFVYYGPQAGQPLDAVAAGFDFNGDGRDDIGFGGRLLDGPIAGNNEGGVGVILGRPYTGSDTIVICDSAFDSPLGSPVVFGRTTNNHVGLGLTGVSDLDGDGRDELAVGSTGEDLGGRNIDNGGVRVLFGADASMELRFLFLAPVTDAYAAAGSHLASADLDGDDRDELVVGGPRYRKNGASIGAVWVVPGAYLNVQDPAALTDHVFPEESPISLRPPGSANRFLLEGETAGESFGQGVAALPAVAGSRGAIAVASPLGDFNGVPRTGGVRLYRFLGSDLERGGLQSQPYAAVGGDTVSTGNGTGAALHAARRGTAFGLVMGAHYSSVTSLEDGAAYVVEVPAP